MESPTTFGKYFLTEKLATGGMGEIYHGKLLGPGGFEKQLVIKQIHPELASRREFVELFVAEAKTMVSLSHGNIVPIYELGVVGGTYFIAMEYVEGPTLSELLRAARARKRTLGAPFAAFICAELLKGLEYAHRKGGGVVHRDLSPRNVMVSRDGEVKILDFGLAATLDAAAAGDSFGARPAGSYPYMSPEQAARKPLDARTDLFSVGILLWEMLTGAQLFARVGDEETLEAVREAPIPAPSERTPELAPDLEAICLRALERDVDARFASAAEFLAALGKYLYRADPPITQTALSRLVAELCPDTPREPAPRAPPPDDLESAVGGPATRPMPRRAPTDPGATPRAGGEERTESDVRTFATRVGFDAIAEHATTPGAPAPVVSKQPSPSAAEPPPERVEPEAAAEPRPSWRVPAVLAAAAALAAGVAIAVRATGDDRPGPSDRRVVAPPLVDAGARAASPIDAAPPRPVDATPPPAIDAAPKIKRPAGKGLVRVSTPQVNWTELYVDGERRGETPQMLELPAGPHRIKVVCTPAQCPPDGETKERSIEVKANQEQLVEMKF